MAKRVLILQTDPKSAQALVGFLLKRGDHVWKTANVKHAINKIATEKLDLIFLDIHLPAADLTKIMKLVNQSYPNIGVIVTNRHPDYKSELLARELGVSVFLRYPFTPQWIENAITRLERGDLSSNKQEALPKVRVPMRYKITLPFAILALLFALASGFLVSRYVLESMMERYTIQLIDTGKLSADWMVQEESRLLETLRLVANTEGVATAVREKDIETLRVTTLPIAFNAQEEAIEILDRNGISLISLHQPRPGGLENIEITQGETSLSQLDFVLKVLRGQVDDRGDKYAGLARTAWGDYLYIAGPITDSDNQVVGTVLVGKSLDSIVQEIRKNTLGHVTLYDLNGFPLSSTLILSEELEPINPDWIQSLLALQDKESNVREISNASTTYSEILGPWEVRHGSDLGILGASLAQNFLTRPSLITRFQIFIIVILGMIAVIILGAVLANQITNPLSRVVQASIELARGNLEVKVPSNGNDEVSILAQAFNYMVSGLQEGIIYRDLLGRTVSPQVREALRRSFASGDLRLEGQNTEATVLMSDIRGFTALAEKEEPTKILNWLNEYFSELVPVIASFGGVVDKFEGDSMLAFFGILPTPLPVEQSAYQACMASIKMLEIIEEINARRLDRGEPPLLTGIGINTGTLIVGGLGTSDRLNYTVIGDTVNTTQRIQGATRSFGESGIVVSENTLVALGEKRALFKLTPLGEHSLKGKLELLWLYRLYSTLSVESIDGGNSSN